MRCNKLNKSDDLDDMVQGFYIWEPFCKATFQGASPIHEGIVWEGKESFRTSQLKAL